MAGNCNYKHATKCVQHIPCSVTAVLVGTPYSVGRYLLFDRSAELLLLRQRSYS